MLTRILCTLAICCTASCSSTRIAPAAQSSRAGRTYLVRGIFTPVCLGIDRMARELRSDGLDASAHSYVQANEIVQTIEKARATGKREPIVLIGYSTGSNTVYGLAKSLGRAGIPVDLLVSIDPLPSSSARVPANVRRAVNYYHRIVPGIPLLAGRAASAEDPIATRLENIDFAREGHPRGFLNHFNMDEQPEIVAAVRKLALETCPPRDARKPQPTSASSPSLQAKTRDAGRERTL